MPHRLRIFLLAAVALLPFSALAADADAPASPTTEAKARDTFQQLTLFADVFERVRADYVDPLTDEQLVEYAVNGLLSSLDAHSAFLTRRDFTDMQTQTKGEFGGLGIEITLEEGLVKIISPIDDTPAARAGLQPGDLITHIDDKPVLELTLTEAIDRMRGPPGTKIRLTLRRGGLASEPFDVTITRAVIKIRSVRSRVEGKAGYIRITTFNEQTQAGLDAALKEMDRALGAQLTGYVLDLRSNPGGLLEQAISVSGTFLDPGALVVSTRGRHKEDEQTFTASGGDRAHGKPIVVLINGGSASASEIVAGALQDHRRAILLGTKSFGKGSVQTVIPVGSGAAMRLTTARYYTPAGRSIQAEGIVPDIDVPLAKVEALDVKMIREADLKGALENENGAQDKNQDKNSADAKPAAPPAAPEDPKKAEEKAAQEDYQLMRALDLLQGVHLFTTVAPTPAATPTPAPAAPKSPPPAAR